MKNIKLLSIGLILAGGLVLASCKKEDMSQYAKKEEVKKATIENIDLTITPNQWTWNATYNSWEFSYSHIDKGALVGYVLTGQGLHVLPHYDANTGVTYGLMDNTAWEGTIVITYYDGTDDLAKPSSNEYVDLKIIPSALRKAHVDYSDFEAVAKAHSF
jgi:hypothetical protein